MIIFELLNLYGGFSRRAFLGYNAKLSKTFKINIIEILILIMRISQKDIFYSA